MDKNNTTAAAESKHTPCFLLLFKNSKMEKKKTAQYNLSGSREV